MKRDIILKLIELLVDSDGTSNADPQSKAPQDILVGKYVICRTRNEGVNFGKVLQADNNGVHLAECRRLHYFKPAIKSESWYEGVAAHGVSSDSRISMQSEKLIQEDYSLTVCTKKAIESIQEAKTHEQS